MSAKKGGRRASGAPGGGAGLPDAPGAADAAAAASTPFAALTPDAVLDAAEALGLAPDGRLFALNSY
jgi:hypothetical protein